MATSRRARPAGPSEETKAKFRQALERKQARSGHTDAAETDGSRVHPGHGPATAQRMFRRKAGG